MHDPDRDVDLVKALVTSWLATRSWAEHLLVDALELQRPEDVLRKEHRGRRQLPGSPWWYRTHGVGVDVFQPGHKGGIDFDFDNPSPDAWRLRIFMIRQFNGGHLTKRDYRPLLQDQSRWDEAVAVALHPARVDWTRKAWAIGAVIGFFVGAVQSVEAVKAQIDLSETFEHAMPKEEVVLFGTPVVFVLVVVFWMFRRHGFSIQSASLGLIYSSPAVVFVLILHAIRAALKGGHEDPGAIFSAAVYGFVALVVYVFVVWRWGAPAARRRSQVRTR